MFKELQPNLFILWGEEYSCNSFLIKGKTNALIDTGLSQAIPSLQQSLNELNLSPEEIHLILHTHGHSDHFQADHLFKKAGIRMSKADGEKVNQKNALFTASNLTGESNYPTITSFLKENESIKLNEFNLKVIFTPGHTEGSICFYEESKKLLFSGDTIFRESIGRSDLPSGNPEELFNSIKKLSELNTSFLLPGHGETVKGEKAVKDNFESALLFLK
ncbi:MAG: MBL fold metallo-hydrolase [archaeon]